MMSFVLDNVEDVSISAETKACVLQIGHELNYIPDVVAQLWRLIAATGCPLDDRLIG